MLVKQEQQQQATIASSSVCDLQFNVNLSVNRKHLVLELFLNILVFLITLAIDSSLKYSNGKIWLIGTRTYTALNIKH